MALQLRLRIIERLQALNVKPQTASELAQWLFEAYPEECAEKKANSDLTSTGICATA